MQTGEAVMTEMRGAPLKPGQAPRVERMLEQLAESSRIPLPSLWVLDSDAPNACAAGESPYVATVGLTRSAIQCLHPTEMRAVLAHEVAHIASGHLADRTAAALRRAGVTAHQVGRGAWTVARVLSNVHPILAVGVGAASIGAQNYGLSKVNEGFALNRHQEMEADAFAHRLGFGRQLSTALIKMERAPISDGSAPPEWAHGLLFAGQLDLADHPPTIDRVRAGLTAVPGPGINCPTCFAPLSNAGSKCACGDGPDRSCQCGAALGSDYRFCGDCGRPVPDVSCRLCGHRDTMAAPFCSHCGLPLP